MNKQRNIYGNWNEIVLYGVDNVLLLIKGLTKLILIGCRGLWNVPFVTNIYLVRGDVIHNAKTKPSYIHNLLDADMAFCTNMRSKDVYVYVTNRLDWGHLIDAENFETTHLNNEMYEIKNNRWDWEHRYLHANYTQSLNTENKVAMVNQVHSTHWNIFESWTVSSNSFVTL